MVPVDIAAIIANTFMLQLVFPAGYSGHYDTSKLVRPGTGYFKDPENICGGMVGPDFTAQPVSLFSNRWRVRSVLVAAVASVVLWLRCVTWQK